MAEDKDTMEQGTDQIEVEIEPEVEEQRPRLRTGDTSSLDVRDEEISGYGKGVQDRIKKLRFAFHEERRQREQKERDLAATNEYAQRMYRENAELKKNVRAGEQAVVHQALSRADAEIAQAKSKARAAHESGVADDIVASTEELSRAVAEKDRLSMLKEPPAAEPPAGEKPPQPTPEADAHTRNWFAKNTWYGKPGEEERSAFAMGVHNKLLAKGISAASNPEVYWRTIDERLAAIFPEKNGNGNGADAGDEGDGREPRRENEREFTSSRPLAVAGGTRSNTGATPAARTRVIRLTESQVRVARRLGLTPEQYAQQVAIDSEAASA
jgi:hypothetical protein